MARLEFFFDFASPWSYMAACQVEDAAAAASAELIWRPVDMGAVFEQVNPGVAVMRATPVPAKITHYYKDMKDWARRLGITIGRPPVYGGASRQLRCPAALRGVFIAEAHERIPDYVRAMYEAYWHDLRDLADEEVLADIAGTLGFDVADFRQRTASAELSKRLLANQDELIDRGGFGVPTFFVNGDDMYFGNDRLGFVREALSTA